jgi:hypothetical protein
MLHGTSNKITGPYVWGKKPNIKIDNLGPFDGPKSVVYTERGTNKTKYSLWLGGGVYIADSVDGPFDKLKEFTYPGHNPAPLWYKGAFYYTNMAGTKSSTVYTTPHLVAGAKWTVYGSIDNSDVPENWIPEDPTMWVDKRGSFHIINHGKTCMSTRIALRPC